MADRTEGTYWRIAWSKDWADAHPWSLSGELMPYIGRRVQRYSDKGTYKGGVQMIIIGPIAIIGVTIAGLK